MPKPETKPVGFRLELPDRDELLDYARRRRLSIGTVTRTIVMEELARERERLAAAN